MRIMFIGTSSNAGKTLISALLCRYLRSKMIMVTPFKALNLSSCSFRTDDGSEIGVGQAMQAVASDIAPSGMMNPVLIKPAAAGMEVVANRAGKTIKRDRDSLFTHALQTYDKLWDWYEAVVCEGSGSPAEINLRDRDIANVNFASARNIPMILIGDIEKGGVFAGIYGTWKLINDKDKHLLKGFMINKYTGDPAILKSGIERVEELTGMRCMGVLPHMKIKLPEEDSDVSGKRKFVTEDMNEYVVALDNMLTEISGSVDWEGIVKIMNE